MYSNNNKAHLQIEDELIRPLSSCISIGIVDEIVRASLVHNTCCRIFKPFLLISCKERIY